MSEERLKRRRSMAYLTSSETPATRMFTMLPNASVACRNVATVLSGLSQACRHFLAVVVVVVIKSIMSTGCLCAAFLPKVLGGGLILYAVKMALYQMNI